MIYGTKDLILWWVWKWLTSLIFSNSINVRLIIEQLLGWHIPLLGYILLPSPWELLDGLTEPFFLGICNTIHGELPVQFPCHPWSSAPCWKECSVHVLSLHKFQKTRWISRGWMPSLPQEPCGPSLTITIISHFAMLVHAVQSLDFVMNQQFFRGIHDYRVLGGGIVY